MRKVYILLYIMLSILLCTSVYSAPSIKDVTISVGLLTLSPNIPEAILINKSWIFDIHIINSTHLIENATCSLHIYAEDFGGGHLYYNSTSIVSYDYDFEMVVPESVHSRKGLYSYKAFCNTTNQAGLYEKSYYVTKSGQSPAEDNFTIFIYILFIITTMGLFYTLFLTIAKLVTASETIYGVLISWSFFVLTIIVQYLAQEYLLRTFVETLTNTFLIITAWTNGVLPLLGFIITMIVKSLQKKKNPSVQELSGFKKW